MRGLIDRGFDMGVFKPRSGHNYWYQYDAFLSCVDEGQLFCSDIIKLREACREDTLPYELMNPIDSLLSPLKVDNYLIENEWNQFFIDDYQTFSHLVMERYTIYNSEIVNIICLNSNNFKNVLSPEKMFLEEVISKADETIELDCLRKWNQVYKKLSSKAILSCYEKICEKYENILIEGYNDAICPDPKLKYDIILGVAPGIVIFYEPERYSQIIKFMRNSGKNPLTLRAKNILEYTRESEIIKIPPLTSEEKNDTNILSKKLSLLIDYIEGKLEHIFSRIS